MASSVTKSSSPEIHIPDEWVNAANSIAYDSIISPPPIALICGAKNSGKTTFSRHLLNTLLRRYKRVAYLDTDVGQSEFTPPGCLSLTVIDKITPDLTIPCLKTPERCYFFGDTSSKRDPTAYLKYIFALYDYYVKEHYTKDLDGSPCGDELPLIVNTAGWVKGIGLRTLVDMLKYIAPSHVIKIDISARSKNLPDGIFWLDDDDCVSVNLIQINAAPKHAHNRDTIIDLSNALVGADLIFIYLPVTLILRMNPISFDGPSSFFDPLASQRERKEAHMHRVLRLRAYFMQCLPRDLSINMKKELAHAIASHPPYQVPIPSIKIKHLHSQVPGSEIFYSLNATIVGLAVSSGQPDDLPICVGLGIVRGIDTFKNLLYILTPVPQSTLVHVDLILQGFIQIPTDLLEEGMSPYMSANVLRTN